MRSLVRFQHVPLNFQAVTSFKGVAAFLFAYNLISIIMRKPGRNKPAYTHFIIIIIFLQIALLACTQEQSKQETVLDEVVTIYNEIFYDVPEVPRWRERLGFEGKRANVGDDITRWTEYLTVWRSEVAQHGTSLDHLLTVFLLRGLCTHG